MGLRSIKKELSTRQIVSLIAFIVVAAFGGKLQIFADELPSATWYFLSHPTVFQPPLADPRSPEMALIVHTSEDPTTATAVLGMRLPLVTYQVSDLLLQLGIDGGSWSELRSELEVEGVNAFALLASDYLIGIPLMGSYRSWSWAISISHISAHLGDGERGKRKPIVYSRELSSLRIAYTVDSLNYHLRLYGGGGMINHTIPRNLNPWFGGGGIELTLPRYYGIIRPYGAMDLAWNGDSGSFGLSGQVGFYFVPVDPARFNVRFAAAAYEGSDRIGQNIGKQIRQFGFGVYFRY